MLRVFTSQLNPLEGTLSFPLFLASEINEMNICKCCRNRLRCALDNNYPRGPSYLLLGGVNILFFILYYYFFL